MSSSERFEPFERPQHPERPERPESEANETVLAETTVTVHRAPRYPNFMILGAVVGAALALVLTIAFPENPEFDRAQVFGFLILAGVTVGVALGAGVALILDRVIGRRAVTVIADRLGTRVPPDVDSQDAASDTQHFNEKSE